MGETDRVIAEIVSERQRQITKEGWAPRHDDEHTDGSLAAAAACYAYTSSLDLNLRAHHGKVDPVDAANTVKFMWPVGWDWWWWKPSTRRRNLIKAAALIVAEIERLDRAQKHEEPNGG